MQWFQISNARALAVLSHVITARRVAWPDLLRSIAPCNDDGFLWRKNSTKKFRQKTVDLYFSGKVQPVFLSCKTTVTVWNMWVRFYHRRYTCEYRRDCFFMSVIRCSFGYSNWIWRVWNFNTEISNCSYYGNHARVRNSKRKRSAGANVPLFSYKSCTGPLPLPSKNLFPDHIHSWQ